MPPSRPHNMCFLELVHGVVMNSVSVFIYSFIIHVCLHLQLATPGPHQCAAFWSLHLQTVLGVHAKPRGLQQEPAPEDGSAGTVVSTHPC